MISTSDAATETARRHGLERVHSLGRAAWRAESGVWRSLYRWTFRRPRVPAGASGFAYHSPVHTILIIFIVLSAVEIPIVDLIVHRWPWVRIPLLFLGVWGVTWMIGLLLSYVTRPHAVGPAGIRARLGADIDVDLRWDDVASIEKSRDVAERAPKVREEPHGRTLALRIHNETNVLILLEHAITARLGDDRVDIDAVRLWVDDLDGFMAAVRTHIP